MHIVSADKDERMLLLKVKNAMRKKEAEDAMKDFLKAEGARTMATQLESKTSLSRITDAVYFKISKTMKDRGAWPLPEGQRITTNKPLDHKHADFSMHIGDYVFLRGTLVNDEDMEVKVRKNIKIAGYVLDGAEVKEHVKAHMKTQAYPYFVFVTLAEDDAQLEKSMTYKEKREADKKVRAASGAS